MLLGQVVVSSTLPVDLAGFTGTYYNDCHPHTAMYVLYVHTHNTYRAPPEVPHVEDSKIKIIQKDAVGGHGHLGDSERAWCHGLHLFSFNRLQEECRIK